MASVHDDLFKEIIDWTKDPLNKPQGQNKFLFGDGVSYYQELCKILKYVKYLRDYVANLPDDIASKEYVDTQVATLNTKIDALETQLVEQIEELDTRESTDYNELSGKITTIQGQIATITSDITHLNQDIVDINTELGKKQATLVSGTNIKTINSQSVLGSGNIQIDGVTNYNELSNKPQIAGTTLEGNKSLDDLSIQHKLTAGTNIDITDNVISATGEVAVDWSNVSNQPLINSHALVSGNNSLTSLGIASATNLETLTGRVTTNESDISDLMTDKQDVITSTNKLSASLVDGLSTVATSGSYNDLSNKPTIPQGTVTSVAVQMNGSTKGTVTTSGTIDLGTVITSQYSLPTASSSTLGGVKVGDRLSISNGVLSANDQSYTLPTASSSTLGGVKVGSRLSISDGVLSANDQSYTLPTATSSLLGGIMVGDRLTIHNGVLSADTQPSIFYGIDTTNIIATGTGTSSGTTTYTVTQDGYFVAYAGGGALIEVSLDSTKITNTVGTSGHPGAVFMPVKNGQIITIQNLGTAGSYYLFGLKS